MMARSEKVAMKHGDFTGLAEDYARFRPGYAPSVLKAVLALVGKPIEMIDAADVGAGTGLWAAMLSAQGCRTVIAVEPNDDMRKRGEDVNRGARIEWRKGSGEETGLLPCSVDFLSMASSFHWVDFDRGTQEFARVLRPGGRFVAVWNPRLMEANPLLAETEAYLGVLSPNLRRVSSGRSGITEKLTELLVAHQSFRDVVYVEGRHTRDQTVEDYIGAWRSANDVQVQLGPKRFAEFIEHVRTHLHGVPTVQITYVTRAWAAERC